MTVKLSTPPTLPKRGGYSQIAEVTSGKLILVAGQVPHDVHDKMVGEGSFEAQVEQVFRNLDAALKAAGGSMKNLVKIMNYCVASVSYEERMVYRTVRDRWIDTTNPPVSTFIYVVQARPAQLAVRDGRDGGNRRVARSGTAPNLILRRRVAPSRRMGTSTLSAVHPSRRRATRGSSG